MPSSIRITQHPLRRPLSWKYTVPCAFSRSNALFQNCSRRMSPSHVSRSYCTFNRAIVFRWHRTMRSATMRPMAATSPSPRSISCSVAARTFRRSLSSSYQPVTRRVQVPAVVVEAGRAGEGLDLGGGPALELTEADHHVGHLHAGVVDVVLNLHRMPEEPQRAHQRVAEGGVPEVADVRGLVRVDGRVLDDHLLARGLARWPDAIRQPVGEIGRPLEIHVQVPVRGALDAGHARAWPRARPRSPGR